MTKILVKNIRPRMNIISTAIKQKIPWLRKQNYNRLNDSAMWLVSSEHWVTDYYRFGNRYAILLYDNSLTRLKWYSIVIF